jgi:hypothetical protein
MNVLLPLLIPLVVGEASAEAPEGTDAAPSDLSQAADLVEVHLGANTPGVRLVVRPPPTAGPDAQPYVVEVMVPPWPAPRPAAPPAAAPTLGAEPLADAPLLLTSPTTSDSVPTASFATQPIAPETAFLRHAPVADLAPPEAPIGSALSEPIPSGAPPAPSAPPPEWAQAAEHYQRSCESGYALACTALAEMAADGQLHAEGSAEAHRWYQRGCDLGDEAACDALAPVTLTSAAPMALPTTAASPSVGSATPATPEPQAAPAVDLTPTAPAPVVAAVQPTGTAPAPVSAFEAERVLFEHCQQGDNRACNDLGERHTHGDGVSQDYDRASKLFQRACAGGELAACTNLGILYKVGEGVSQDELRAERLFQLACNGGAGDETACGLLEE